MEEASERTRTNGHRLQQEKCSLELRKKNLVNEDVSALEQKDCEILMLGDFQNSTGQSPGQHDLTLRIALLRVGAKVGALPCPVPPEVFCDTYTVNTTEATYATEPCHRCFTPYPLCHTGLSSYRHFCPFAPRALLWSLCFAKLDPHCLHQASTHCKALCNNNISWLWFTTIATTQVLGSLRSPISNGVQFNPILSACTPPPTPASEPGQCWAHAVPEPPDGCLELRGSTWGWTFSSASSREGWSPCLSVTDLWMPP